MKGRIRQTVALLSAQVRRRPRVVVIAVALVVAAGVGIALSLYQWAQTEPLMRQADALPVGEARVARQREILQFQADNLAKIWTTIVQAIGAVVLAVGGYFTWRNLGVANEAQITNRFTQAISQLGAELKDGQPNLEVRLGGIYALECIARDSPRDHWTIIEVLTAYVRQNARWTNPTPQDGVVSSPEDLGEPQQVLTEPPQLRTDIQAILTVIGRRKLPKGRPEFAIIQLRRTNLHGASLSNAHFERAEFESTNLEQADLRQAHLQGADMEKANLKKADLMGAHLEPAIWKFDLRRIRRMRTSALPHVRSSFGRVRAP
jgi:hypothetical protein